MNQYGEAYVNEIAPFLWEFTGCDVPKLGVRSYPIHISMWNIATRRLFFNQFGNLQYRVVRQYVRRTIYAARHYSAMRRLTSKYFADFNRSRPQLKIYFDALGEAEACLLNLHIMIDCLHTLDPRLIGEEDYQNVNLLANSIKHFGGQSKGSQKNPIMPIYFTNCGISNGRLDVGFSALREIIAKNVSVTRAIINHKDS